MKKHSGGKASTRRKSGADPSDLRPASKACIIVRDLYTTDAPTDAGSNLLGIAQSMAKRGDIVTLVWVPRYEVQQRLDQAARDWIVERFARLYLIRFEILVDSPGLSPHVSFPEKASLAVYHYLKNNRFDETFISLEGGLAYFTIQAMELGLFVPNGPISLLAHSPTEWLAAADKRFIANVPELAIVHMERYCVEAAPEVVFFSRFIRDWASAKGWAIPHHHLACPLLPEELLIKPSGSGRKRRSPRRPVHLGFWPGWEYRTGVTILYDALDQIAGTTEAAITLNCFGEFSHILGEHTGGMLLRRARSWPFDIRYFPRRTEAECIEYLSSRGGIGVFPDVSSTGSRLLLACLNARVPVVTTNTGAMPELIERGLARHLKTHSSNGIAEALRLAIRGNQVATQPQLDQEQAEVLWEQVRQKIRSSPTRKTDPGQDRKDRPLVSIIIAHYDRPTFLAEALQSVERQDYPNIEVVLVDDGSRKKESLRFLKEIAPHFKARKWKIIRQRNQFLGAARNAGIRASRGRLILFLDDDNALLPHGVSTFVKALESSRSDICTSVSKIFVGKTVPQDDADGLIEYVPLGGSIDLALIHDSFGDANAMIRREVFDKIGYLVEDRGFSGSDWEFFTRAAMNGIKVRIIPEPTYWYRSSASGMFRSSHWYDTRLPILQLFKAKNYAGMDKVLELILAQHTYDGEQKSLEYQLRFDRSNDAMLKLTKMNAQSKESIEFLAEIAASEGRPDTALNLLAFNESSTFLDRAWKIWLSPTIAETSLANEPLPSAQETILGTDKLRQFAIAQGGGSGGLPTSYVESPDRIYFDVTTSNGVVAVLNGSLPPGTTSISVKATVDDEAGDQIQIMLSIIDPNVVALAAKGTKSPPRSPVLGASGWHLLDRRFVEQHVEVQLDQPTSSAASIAVSLKPKARSKLRAGTRVRLRRLSVFALRGLGMAARPRLFAPPDRLQSRPLGESELRSARIATRYPGAGELVEFRQDESGFLLHPSDQGPVVAVMQWAFPPFARSLLATVEIANEEAGPFDFSLALVRPTYLGNWTSGSPSDSLAFSGWRRISRRFELQDIEVSLAEPHRFHLAICAAIRLPKGIKASPDESFWRKFVIRW